MWGLTRSLWKATVVSAKRRREWTTRTGCGNNGGETNCEEQDLVDVENRRHDEGQSISEEGTKHRGDTVRTVPHGDSDRLLAPSVPCHRNNGYRVASAFSRPA